MRTRINARATMISEDCSHPDHLQHIVSDVVIYVGTINSVDGSEDYEFARQIIACKHCGRVAETREIERPPT
jgi:hypothetical protein